MRSDVLLFRSHIINSSIVEEFNQLRSELPDFEHYIIGYSNAQPDENRYELMDGVVELYNDDILSLLPYSFRSLSSTRPRPHLMGDDLPIMQFFRNHDSFKRYWCIEYDVRYTGNWSTLFGELSRSHADLLATNIWSHDDLLEWPHWHTFSWAGKDIPQSNLIKAFLPFCRISRKALLEIDFALSNGVDGHYEVTFPTICKHRDASIEDIGGYGLFTPPQRIGRFYTSDPRESSLSPGSFVFRPAINASEFLEMQKEPNIMWHPIK